jgi:hypothetical protein
MRVVTASNVAITTRHFGPLQLWRERARISPIRNPTARSPRGKNRSSSMHWSEG